MLLPGDTDFYTTEPHPYVGARLPPDDPLARLLPAPREADLLGGEVQLEPGETLPAPTISAVTRAAAAPGTGRLRVALAAPGSDLERELAAAGTPVPEHEEGYAITPLESGLVLAARDPRGLRHGAVTLAALALGGDGGPVRLPRVRIRDEPATALRFLGGWALWRAEGLRDAVDLAAAFKANRVLYNGWGWIPGERLWKEDGWLAERARDRGIELVFELRRMSFGKEHRISEPAHRRAILEQYLRAAESGFRSFGLLFDDVPWETAEDECALAEEVLAALQASLGGSAAPELFVCPQVYWNPGQMDAQWRGRAGPDETARQREYLETYGRRLRPGVHVYVANYWGDHPAGYAAALRDELAALLGRKPVFFDNQLINDYRSGAVYPFALAARPRDFGESYAGYYLNCGRPLAAYAASAAAALAYAWNPGAYRAEEALGAALLWLHGSAGGRAELVAAGVNRLRDLANEWAGGVPTAASHYATIWRQVRGGAAGREALERWRDGLRAARREWLAALGGPARGLLPLAHDALHALVRGSHRLERDLDLFAAYLVALDALEAGRCGHEAVGTFERVAGAVAHEALEAVASILPHAPNLAPLLEAPDALEPRDSQAWSWAEYFLSSTRKALDSVRREMLEELTRRG